MAIISQKTFDKFSEEEKEKVRRDYNTLQMGLSTGLLVEEFEYLFGKENLQPEPKIKTWDDVAAQREYNIDVELNKIKNAWIGYPICNKMIATAKIAKLIELGYGGMVSDEEWKIKI